MQADFPPIDPNEDLTQILPIQQKRTIAFVNHFIMNTVSHLNDFAKSCESRFMEFEYKMQKIESSLLILESQLSSISGLDSLDDKPTELVAKTEPELNVDLPDVGEPEPQPILATPKIPEEPEHKEISGVKAKDDPRFKKFFKMLQFGVPEPAVRLKMRNEGMDASIIENPDAVIPGLPEDMLNESEEKSD